eukprot:752715-Hanusia_phi.AAC.1
MRQGSLVIARASNPSAAFASAQVKSQALQSSSLLNQERYEKHDKKQIDEANPPQNRARGNQGQQML